MYDGEFALNIDNNEGRLAAVLKPKQINEVKESLRGESNNIVSRMAETADAVNSMPGFGFKFSHGAIDYYQSDAVTIVGPDHIGCIFSQGAFASTLGPVDRFSGLMHNQLDIVLKTPELFVIRGYDQVNDVATFTVNSWPSVAEVEDKRAQRVISVT